MPELPDITLYIEALRDRIVGHTLSRVVVRGPFLLRTAIPPVDSVLGQRVRELRRLGKQIAIGFERGHWLVLHLKIAGRLHWRGDAPKPGVKGPLALFEFDSGVLVFTEAGSQHRASLHIVSGEDGLRELEPGGLEVLDADVTAFSKALRAENHTLKRALTDPHLFSGIGNAYSDEILHRACLSPIALTQKLTPAEIERLFHATREVLREWLERLRAATGKQFPEKVTAFRPEMAVHGRFGRPCPRCGAKIQRIRYASNEANYCAPCQTGGKLLADRALSRLLGKDWPRTIEELEARKRP